MKWPELTLRENSTGNDAVVLIGTFVSSPIPRPSISVSKTKTPLPRAAPPRGLKNKNRSGWVHWGEHSHHLMTRAGSTRKLNGNQYGWARKEFS